jgi:CheY-like chemotaxis protein
MNLTVPSLLITDDDRDFLETLREVFEPRGFRTLLARDGLEAVDIAQQQPVHLLLLDMHMPRMTGLETIHRLRQSSLGLASTAAPFILMSAALDPQIVAEAHRAAAYSVLSKPFPVREITGLVSRAMRQFYNWPA